MTLILLGVVAIIIGAWIYLRMRPDSDVDTPLDQTSTLYHAVSIHHYEGACSAAKALTGERFLAAEAPTLPLPGCDAKQCRCRFLHHDDRRATGERRSPFGGSSYGSTMRTGAQERRHGDRRHDDGDLDL